MTSYPASPTSTAVAQASAKAYLISAINRGRLAASSFAATTTDRNDCLPEVHSHSIAKFRPVSRIPRNTGRFERPIGGRTLR